MSRAEIIFELLDEIRRMEDTVLYFQNRITQKQIAIAELMRSWEVGVTQSVPVSVPEPSDKKSYIDWDVFLAHMDGKEFGREEMAKFANGFGLSDDKLKRRISYAVSYWLALGRIRRSGDGLFMKLDGISSNPVR